MTMFDDLTKVNVPFGLLERGTQDALKAHGGPWEVYTGSAGWELVSEPSWVGNAAYRVKPVKPAPPKPREYWIAGHQVWDTYAEAYNDCDRGEKPIHVIEKLPE